MQNYLFLSLQAIWTGEGSALVLPLFYPFFLGSIWLEVGGIRKEVNISLKSWMRLQFSLHLLSLIFWLTHIDHHCPL